MESPKNIRSLTDVFVSMSFTCAAVALIRLLTSDARPAGNLTAMAMFVGFWPALIGTSIAAAATCVVGWSRALQWAAIAFAASVIAFTAIALAVTYGP